MTTPLPPISALAKEPYQPCYLSGHKWVLYGDMHKECSLCGLCCWYPTRSQDGKSDLLVSVLAIKARQATQATQAAYAQPSQPPLPQPLFVDFSGQGREHSDMKADEVWESFTDIVAGLAGFLAIVGSMFLTVAFMRWVIG